jgi:hypothetical protein
MRSAERLSSVSSANRVPCQNWHGFSDIAASLSGSYMKICLSYWVPNAKFDAHRLIDSQPSDTKYEGVYSQNEIRMLTIRFVRVGGFLLLKTLDYE